MNPHQYQENKYQEIIRASRREQLQNDAGAVQSLEALLTKTAASIRHEIMTVPRGILGDRYRRTLLASLDRILDQMRDEYKALLDGGIVQAAQLAEQREQAIINALYTERSGIPPDQVLKLMAARGEAQVSFGTVSRVVLERLYTRVYPDGLQLSQRLYNLDLAARRAVADEVTSALATGASARRLAAAITPHLTEAGVGANPKDNVRYKAMRIARTEINVAYREGTVASATSADGSLKSYISALGFRLSPAHPRICICCQKGTLVETLRGPKPIEDVTLGEPVLTHRGRFRPVTRLYRNTIPAGQLVRLRFQVGKNRTQELVVTPNHPVRVGQEWIEAGDLQTGCTGVALPALRLAPYGLPSRDTLGTAQSSFAESEPSGYGRTIGAERYDARLRHRFRKAHTRFQEWLFPKCARLSGSGTVLPSRRPSNLGSPRPSALEIASCAFLRFLAVARTAGAAGLYGRQNSKGESSISRLWRSSWRQRAVRTAGRQVFPPCEHSGSTRWSSTAALSHPIWPQMAFGRPRRSWAVGGLLPARRTSDCKSAAPSFGTDSAPQHHAEQVHYHNVHNSLSCLDYSMINGKCQDACLIEKTFIPTSGETVFNLEVADDHTYFASGILTHNCDLYAGQDDGLGAGNYLPEDVPTAPHPHCLCYLVTILAALPDQQFTALEPHPDEVPESQLKYYGAKQ